MSGRFNKSYCKWYVIAHGTYLWSTGATTQSITVTQNNTSTYSCTYTTVAGCTATEFVTVTVDIPNITVNSPTVCGDGINNVTVPLVANGAVSYVWSPASGLSATTGSTVNATVSTTSSFLVTGTDNIGCTNSAWSIITYAIAPTITIVPNNSCGPVTLTASADMPGGSFVWNPLTGLSSFNFNGSSVLANPAVPTTYTVTYGVLTSGCKSNPVYVSVNPGPLPLSIDGLSSICDFTQPFLYNVVGYNSNNPPVISIFPASSYTGTPTINAGILTILWNTNLPVTGATITLTEPGNIYGCPQTCSLTVYPCCKNPDVSNNVIVDLGDGGSTTNNSTLGTHLDHASQLIGNSSLLPSWASLNGNMIEVITRTFSINGTFTVDADLTFNIYCDITLGKDAKIVLINNHKLYIHESHLYGCYALWDKISVSNPNQLVTIDGSLIEDAKTAVNSVSGGQYLIANSVFNKCLTGISVSNSFTSMANCKVSNCIFTCRNVSSSFFLQVHIDYLNSAYPFSSIPAMYPAALLLPPFNTQRSNNGIEIKDMLNLTPLIIGATAPSFQARSNVFDAIDCGVKITNSNVNVINNMFVRIKGPYTNLRTAVKAEFNSSLVHLASLLVGGPNTGEDNKFDNCDNAVISNDYNNIVHGNTMSNITNFGVYLNYLGNAAGRRNTVDFNTMTQTKGGIFCKNIVNSPSTSISDNNISLLGNSGGNALYHTAINIINPVVGYASLNIAHNNIYNSIFGVYLSGTVKAKVMANQITPNTIGLTPVKYGIKAINCDKTEIGNNTVFGPTLPPINQWSIQGIALQDSPDSWVHNNNLNQMGEGVYSQYDCHVSSLECNTFYNCTKGFSFGNADIGDQLPGTSQTSTGNHWNSMASTDFIDGTVHNPANAPTFQFNWYWQIGTTTDPTNSLMPTINYIQTQNSNSCGVHSPITIAEERELNLGRIVKGLNQYDTLSAEYLLRDSIYCFHQLKTNDTLMRLGTTDDTLYQHFFDFAKTGNIGKFEKVNTIILDSIIADTTTAEFVNQNIFPKCSMDENKQIVNAIYLNKWKNDADTTNLKHYQFDSTEIFQLNNIAYQNPLLGGFAVYEARAMLNIDVIDEVLSIDKSITIGNHMEESKKSDFILYPNPNDGNMILDYSIDDNQYGTLSLYDIAGKLVNSYNFYGSKKSMRIDGTSLQAGSYFYLIKIGDKITKTNKLIIIK